LCGVQFYRDADLPFFELKACGVSDISYKKHSHEEYSIGIVDNGKSSFWYEGKIVEVGSNTIVLIPPEMVHSCNPQKEEQWKYKMLFIDAAWMQNFLQSKAIHAFNHPIVKNISDCAVFNMMDSMIDSLTGHASPLEKEATIISVLEQAVGGINNVKNVSLERELSRLEAVKDYLHSNFLQKITLDQLARVSGLNKFKIIRSFKEEFSIPPHTYQTLLRINFAKKQLRKNRKIVEVAHETGFYDQSHFNKVFKSHIGVTPERYQKLK